MKFLVFAIVCLAASAAMPLNVVEDVNGEQYYMVPIHRERRYRPESHKNLLNYDRHRLDGTGSVGKNFGSHGFRPDQIGGRLDYTYKPLKSSIFLGADNTRGLGTDVKAGLKYNIHQGKNYGVDLTGQYGRHFGGPGGTGRPETGVFLNAHYNF